MPEIIEFPPVSYADWAAVAAPKSKILWGPEDLPADLPPARDQGGWEALEAVPAGLCEINEIPADPVAQLRQALASGDTSSEFLVPVDTFYFPEIAKFRALRRLFDRAIRVVAITGRVHQTVYDPHVNLLRSTTCAMAAIIGGCDALIVRPFEDSELGRRMARNAQHLLREESHFGRLRDAAAGSWYIEALTQQYVDAARGASPPPPPAMRRTLVGVTKYVNPDETLPPGTEISEGRIATPWEKLRHSLEHSATRPKIRLVMGNDRKMANARAEFARSAFTACGFQVGEPARYEVLCGADEEYPEMVAKAALPAIVAGPEVAGALGCVNMKSNIPEKLAQWI